MDEVGVCRHEAGHFTIGLVNGFKMGAVLIIAAEVGHGGRVWYPGEFESSTNEDDLRAAIRTCLAGEVARVGAERLQDFDHDAADDVALATTLASRVGEAPAAILEIELAKVLEEVKAHESQIAALVDLLLAARRNPNGHYGLNSTQAAKAIGYQPERDSDNRITGFVVAAP